MRITPSIIMKSNMAKSKKSKKPLIAIGAVLVLGAYLILQGELTVGMLMAFQGFMGSFLEPVNAIVNASQTIVEMRSQMERVEDVMKYPEDHRDHEGEVMKGKLTGLLDLKNVTFGYSPLQPPLIEDFNLKIEPGHSVAFSMDAPLRVFRTRNLQTQWL